MLATFASLHAARAEALTLREHPARLTPEPSSTRPHDAPQASLHCLRPFSAHSEFPYQQQDSAFDLNEGAQTEVVSRA